MAAPGSLVALSQTSGLPRILDGSRTARSRRAVTISVAAAIANPTTRPALPAVGSFF